MSYVLYEADGEDAARWPHCGAFGRTVRAEAFPIGIEAEGFRKMLDTDAAGKVMHAWWKARPDAK